VSRTEELINVLEELIGILDRVNADHWRDWMSRALARLRNGDMTGIDVLLGAYGGMGSFNDFVIGGHGQPDLKPLGDRFEVLQTRAWELATAIAKSRPLLERVRRFVAWR
jgi:hypothetical protein